MPFVLIAASSILGSVVPFQPTLVASKYPIFPKNIAAFATTPEKHSDYNELCVMRGVEFSRLVIFLVKTCFFDFYQFLAKFLCSGEFNWLLQSFFLCVFIFPGLYGCHIIFRRIQNSISDSLISDISQKRRIRKEHNNFNDY
jgi:hypothetical protein